MDFIVEKNRIYKLDENGKLLAEVLFPESEDGTVTITRTFVDDSLRGQGVAGKLILALTEELKSQGKPAEPACSYAVKWFGDHPEYNHLIKSPE